MKNLLFISALSLVLIGSEACSSDTPVNSGVVKNSNSANVQESSPANIDSNVYPLNEPINTANIQNVKVNKPGTVAVTPAGRLMPDGSEVFTELRDVPIETRIFKNHPQLLKVVKSGAPDRATVKVYLKSGKIVEIPGDKVPNLSNAQAADILNAAGVKPEAPPPGETRSDTKNPDKKQ